MCGERRVGRRGRWAKLAVTAILLAGELLAAGGQDAGVAQAATNVDAELVYLDQNGVIRVLDPNAAEGLNVGWFSPEGAWKSVALADVTGDADDEIIAIRDDGNGGRLKVYDPVAVGAPEDQVQYLDEVPWSTLYDVTLPGQPLLVGAGEFDAGRAGMEIVYIYELPADQRTADDLYQLVILHAANADADGRAWETLATWNTGNKWTWFAMGDMDANGIDEIALVANELGNLSIYRVTSGGFVRMYRNVNIDNEWRAVEFGQFAAGGAEELAAVRAADYPLASAWIFRWDGADVQDVFAGHFIPSPRVVFWADISGNNDDEIVMLRDVPQEMGLRARLIVRDNGNDTIAMGEPTLDADDGYRTGAGGDFDGDGRDEIAVARSNRIRLFTAPEQSAAVEDHNLSNDARVLRAGNLDAEGLGRSPRLGATPAVVKVTVRAGTVSNPQAVAVTDATTGSAIPVTGRLQNASAWLIWSMSISSTPLILNVTANAAGKQPGVYVDHVLIDALTEGVVNDPLSVAVTLTVESGVTASPDSLEFVYYPCTDLVTRTAQVQLTGEAGKLFSTQIAGAPAWVTVEPPTGELPATATVTVNPALRPVDVADVRDAELLVSVDWPGAPDTRERIPIRLVCSNERVILPLVFGSP